MASRLVVAESFEDSGVLGTIDPVVIAAAAVAAEKSACFEMTGRVAFVVVPVGEMGWMLL